MQVSEHAQDKDRYIIFPVNLTIRVRAHWDKVGIGVFNNWSQ